MYTIGKLYGLDERDHGFQIRKTKENFWDLDPITQFEQLLRANRFGEAPGEAVITPPFNKATEVYQ